MNIYQLLRLWEAIAGVCENIHDESSWKLNEKCQFLETHFSHFLNIKQPVKDLVQLEEKSCE